MRTLLLLRGAPGAGKSTWIKNNGLQPYTVSPDELRKMYSSPKLTPLGKYIISQERDNEQAVWDGIFTILEHRMQRGEFTVVDATCSKTKDMQQYKALCEAYRYRIFVIDFTDVPLEVCLEQNKQRDELKHVPEEAIRNIYARFATQQIPGGITILKPDQWKVIEDKPIDLSAYDKIIHIGDCHGCFDTLMKYFEENPMQDNYCYIFHGDYIDRGNQNGEMMNWLKTIMNKSNVCLLEGNHERHIYNYGKGAPAVSKVFEYKTKRQLMEHNFTEKDARMFYRKLRQMSHYIYNGIEVLACHGGIPNLNTNLLYLPTQDLIKGVGEYDDYTTIAETWMLTTKENQFLVHGHRNTNDDRIRVGDRVFNLEGKIEFGGDLRIIELDKSLEWNEVYVKDCQPITEDLNTEQRAIETVEDAVNYLRNNRFIKENKLSANVSSFNFTREAFMKGNWNKQTVLARGLFIDHVNNKIMARSYEKFFNVSENFQTELSTLKTKMQFPVKAYLKENGFLGMVAYDYINDDLFVASKTTNWGDHVKYIWRIIRSKKGREQKILEYLRNKYNNNEPVTLVFEIIDIENDPHIIKYDESDMVLLDIISNKLELEKAAYGEIEYTAHLIDCSYKKLAFTLNNWNEFRGLLYRTDYIDFTLNEMPVEGFVFEDSNGYQVKKKTAYYNNWKFLRGVADTVLRRGVYPRMSALTTASQNYFYGFCKDLYKEYIEEKGCEEYPFKTDIITLRDLYSFKYPSD